MICPYDIGIEDEAIESSCGHSEVEFQHGYNEYNPCQSKWDEKKNVDASNGGLSEHHRMGLYPETL